MNLVMKYVLTLLTTTLLFVSCGGDDPIATPVCSFPVVFGLDGGDASVDYYYEGTDTNPQKLVEDVLLQDIVLLDGDGQGLDFFSTKRAVGNNLYEELSNEWLTIKTLNESDSHKINVNIAQSEKERCIELCLFVKGLELPILHIKQIDKQ